MSDHTPGPWHVDESSAGALEIISDFGDIAMVRGARNPDDETMPNARVLAAAPDMKALLRLALQYLEHPDVQAIPFALNAGVVADRVKALLAEVEGA